MQTRVDEATTLARSVLQALDERSSIAQVLRQCERLGDLLDDAFMKEYANRALQPGLTSDQQETDLNYLRKNRDARASGLLRFYQDFQLPGEPLAAQLARENISVSLLNKSVPEAETFVVGARKTMNYSISQRDFTATVELAESVLERVRNRLYRYASAALSRLLFEEIPERVMEATRRKVDERLAEMCPQALEKFRVAYEELAGSSTENWSNACNAARRILLDFADAVYPSRDELVDGRKVGKQEYVNRLWAYTKEKLTSSSNREVVQAELVDLGNRTDAIYRLSNKGVHDTVSKDEADRIMVRTYLLIADLL